MTGGVAQKNTEHVDTTLTPSDLAHYSNLLFDMESAVQKTATGPVQHLKLISGTSPSTAHSRAFLRGEPLREDRPPQELRASAPVDEAKQPRPTSCNKIVPFPEGDGVMLHMCPWKKKCPVTALGFPQHRQSRETRIRMKLWQESS
jgi:hypothetical protein